MEKEKAATENKIVILYGSQTGNAYDVAERISREAERRRCSVSVTSLLDFHAGSLPEQKTVIFVVSTTGQGDAPDSMKSFWRKLLQRNLGGKWLEGVQYAVFGLGDSGYQKYNFVAKKLDKRLVDLGATAIVEKGLGDDQHPLGYEGALDPWMSSLWNALYQNNPKFFPDGPLAIDLKWTDQCKFHVIYHDSNDIVSQSSHNSDIKHLQMQKETARSMSPGKFPQDKRRPDCLLKMVRNCPLTITRSKKDVRHFEFEPVSSIIDYEVGDVVEILPGQSPASVDAFIERSNLNPEAYISVHPRGTEQDLLELNFPIKLKSFVEFTMDVASASPRRYFFEIMSYFASAEHERERLQYFVSPEGRDDLYQYNQKERRTVLEVLEDFPSVQMPFEWLVQLVPPLKTRAFSISSSHSVHPNQVHLTVSVVSWMTPLKRQRMGLCSSWLAGLNPQADTSVCIPAWFQKGSLPPPPPSLPLILVGPGTGCAPFRGFIEKRALESKTEPVGATLFFFGCHNENNDFLYKDFWLFQSEQGGVLSEDRGGGFCVAFSRDQSKKVYVQHKIQDYSEQIWGLLMEGAAIYVAGSSTKMPADVFSAFEEIVSRESGVSREAAARWLRALEKAGKYHVEAWS